MTTAVRPGGKTLRKPKAVASPPVSSGSHHGRKSQLPKLASKSMISALRGHGDWITLADVANMFGVTRATLRSWSQSGQLPKGQQRPGYGSNGRELYFAVPDLIKSIEQCMADNNCEQGL